MFLGGLGVALPVPLLILVGLYITTANEITRGAVLDLFLVGWLAILCPLAVLSSCGMDGTHSSLCVLRVGARLPDGLAVERSLLDESGLEEDENNDEEQGENRADGKD